MHRALDSFVILSRKWQQNSPIGNRGVLPSPQKGPDQLKKRKKEIFKKDFSSFPNQWETLCAFMQLASFSLSVVESFLLQK